MLSDDVQTSMYVDVSKHRRKCLYCGTAIPTGEKSIKIIKMMKGICLKCFKKNTIKILGPDKFVPGFGSDVMAELI